MATIVIAMLPELGHLNATLKLAKTLMARGHQIYYLGGSDHRAYLEQQQMRFVSLAEGLRPQTREFATRRDGISVGSQPAAGRSMNISHT